MSFFRLLGCILLVALCLYSGMLKIQEPKTFVTQVMKGNLPALIEKAGIAKHVPGFKFTEKEATMLVQAVGGVMVACSVMIIVNLGRAFSAFVLAMLLIVVTVCQHMDIKDPAKTPVADQIQAFKNLGIVGGLFILVGGFGNARSETAKVTVSDSKKNF